MVWQHFAHCTCLHCSSTAHCTYSMLCSVFCTVHVAVYCIFHASFCILHCSHYRTLHFPCFALYFALLTLQHIAYSMLSSVFCPAHIAEHCIFHALLCILHCLHCRNLHISYALFCISHCSIAAHCIFHALFSILHCSHCNTLHISCFALYFELLILQHIAYSMLCSVF